MLLSCKYNFLFVHIAKTGGTSLRAALRRLQRRDPLFPAMFLASRLSHLTGHRIGSKFPRHARVIAAQEMLPKELFDGLFKFAFVRNPWDLQVSAFHHLQRERPALVRDCPDFPVFLRWKLSPERSYQYHLDTFSGQQRDYLVDLRGKIVVDFVGRFERLAEDYDTVGRRLGVTLPALPHKRRASDRSQDYRRYYDETSAELVAEHYRGDIEAFGYTFDPA